MRRRGPSRRTSPPANDRAHEHEWRPEPAVVEHDEYVYVAYECMWAEVTSATTSERHDETFYGYGAECAATKRVTWSIQPYFLAEDEERKMKSPPTEEVYYSVVEPNVDALYETAATVDPHDVPKYAGGVEVETDGGRYYVELQRDDVSVEEDWK